MARQYEGAIHNTFNIFHGVVFVDFHHILLIRLLFTFYDEFNLSFNFFSRQRFSIAIERKCLLKLIKFLFEKIKNFYYKLLIT